MKTFTKFVLVVSLVLVSHNVFGQWTLINTTPPQGCIATAGTDFYSAGSTASDTLMYSSNGGVTWVTRNLIGQITCLAVKGDYVFAGITSLNSSDNGLYISTNKGVNWTKNPLLTYQPRDILVANSTDVYVVDYTGVYMSANNIDFYPRLVASGLKCLAANRTGTTVYIGGSGYPNAGGLRKTIDRGATWNWVGLQDTGVTCIAVSGSSIYCNNYRSTNNGVTWTNIPLAEPYENIEKLILLDSTNVGYYVLAKTTRNRIYISKNNSMNWNDKTYNMTVGGTMDFELVYTKTYGLVYTRDRDGKLYRCTYSDIIGIRSISSEIPSKYSLSQNYPNPFNPSTNIKYQITKNDNVSLKIFDILGQEIATLINEKQSPGTYSVDWNASDYTSGIYFYRLQAGNFTETKRMTLIK